jgi:hypothetical protein
MRKLIYKMFLFMFITTSVAFSNEFDGGEEKYIYTIETSDELGVIIQSLGLKPLWGENGYVQKTIKLNRLEVKANGNIIYPSEKIILPARPKLECNSILEGDRVRIISKVKSRDEYKGLLNSFSDGCDEGQTSKDLPAPVATVETEKARKSVAEEPKLASASVPKSHFDRYSKMSIAPRLGYSRISSTDAENGSKARVVSDVNLGMRLSWHHIRSEKMEWLYFIDLEKQTYLPNPNRVLRNDSVNLLNSGVGMKYSFTENFFLNSDIGFGEEVFLFAPDDSILRLDKANVFKGRGGIGLTLLNQKYFNVEGEIGMRALSATEIKDYKTKAGIGRYGLLRLNQNTEKSEASFMGSLEYESQNKDTTRFKQVHTNLRLVFGINWYL